MVDERHAIESLRSLGTARALAFAQEIEHGAARFATPRGAAPVGPAHEYGTQDDARFCRHCGYPTQWMCFTCHKHLCFTCIQDHNKTRTSQYVGHKGSHTMPSECHDDDLVRSHATNPTDEQTKQPRWKRWLARLTGVSTGTNEPTIPFDQLSPTARRRAALTVQDRLGGVWWDEDDEADVRDAMILALAEKLGTPDYLDGSGEVHGIPGVSIDEWLFDEPSSIWVNGSLTRENAPSLPWPDGIASITLAARTETGTTVQLIDAQPVCTCSTNEQAPGHDIDCLALLPAAVPPEQRWRLNNLMRHILEATWEAGRIERDSKTSIEHARYVAEDYLFTADGAVVSELPA